MEISIFLLVFLFHPHFVSAIPKETFLQPLLFYHLFFYQLNNQLLLLFFELLFLKQFLLHCRFFSTIKKFLTIFIT